MSDKYANSILFDWLSVSYGGEDCGVVTPHEVISFFGLQNVAFTDGPGYYGFRKRLYFEGISIHYDRYDNFVLLEMSGQGCRAFETYSSNPDWNKYFKLISNDPRWNITRLDIAYDDFSGILNQSKLDLFMSKNNVVTKFRDYGVKDRSYVNGGFTLYFGSQKSDLYIRCYNKAAERGREEEFKHWVRFELQLRRDHAKVFVENYLLLGCDIGSCFLSVVNNYIRFVKPGEDSNKSRWDTAKFWSDFLGSVERISLYSKKDLEYNESKLLNYTVAQAGQAIKCAIDIFGIDGYMEILNKYLEEHKFNKNPKYDELVRKYNEKELEHNE